MSKGWKWALGIFFSVCFVALVIGFVAIKIYLNPFLKHQIEQKASQALGGEVTLERLNVHLLPPFKIDIQNLQIRKNQPQLQLGIKNAVVIFHPDWIGLQSRSRLGKISISVIDPELQVQATPPNENAPSPPATTTTSSAESFPDFALYFKMQNAKISFSQSGTSGLKTTTTLTLTSIDTDSFKSGETQIRLQGESRVITSGVKPLEVQLPFEFEGKTQMKGQILSVENGALKLAGLSAQISGQQNLDSEQASWKVSALVPELNQLPIPPTFLPPGRFSGKIEATLEAKKSGTATPWLASGQVQLVNLRGSEINFTKDQLQMKGAASLNAHFDFLYDQVVTLKIAKLSAQLSDLSISQPTTLLKPAGTPFEIEFEGSGSDQSLAIKKLDLTFANLKAKTTGQVERESGKITELDFEISRTDLTGWEKFFPALATAPASGFIQAKGNVRGDLSQSQSMSIELSPLTLEKLKIAIDYQSDPPGLKIAGPVSASGDIRLKTRGPEIIDANANMTAHLSDLAMEKTGIFKKTKGFPLSLTLMAAKKANQLEFKNTRLQVGSSSIALSGTLANPQAPDLNLNLSLTRIQFEEILKLLATPPEATKGLAGTLEGSVDLRGKFDFKEGIQKSPLRLTSRLRAQIPTFTYRSKPKTTTVPPGSPESPAPPERLLPDWPILNTAQIEARVIVQKFLFNDLSISGIDGQANLQSGILTAKAKIENIFQGQMQLKNLKTSLIEKQPSTSAELSVTKMDIATAVHWLNSEFKDTVRGSASGEMTLSMAHPSRADFVASSTAQGKLNLKNGWVGTMPVDQMINESLAKIPGIGDENRVATKGVAADIGLSFKFENSKLHLHQFDFITPEKNQIVAKGTVALDKTADLTATAFLTNAFIGGSVRAANSDAQGRFEIPLKIQGQLMKPQVSFAEETIRQLLSKTATYEFEKQKKNLQEKAKNEAEKALGNKLEEIKKQGLKGLLGH